MQLMTILFSREIARQDQRDREKKFQFSARNKRLSSSANLGYAGADMLVKNIIIVTKANI